MRVLWTSWAAAVLLCAGACAPSERDQAAPGGDSGQLHVALSGDAATPLVTFAVQSVFDPSQMFVVECPVKDHTLNGATFCDELIVVPPGVYEIVVQSQDRGCATEQDHYKVIVREAETTEVALTLYCKHATGGLDMIVTQHDVPNVADIDFSFVVTGLKANKYVCACGQDVKVEVTVEDADTACADLTGTWQAFDSGGVDVTGLLLANETQLPGTPCRFSAEIDSGQPTGDYQVTFTVDDGVSEPVPFTFPIHLIDCGYDCSATCPPGTLDCAGTCVAPLSDPQNCGGCGLACAAGSTCVNGHCTTGCPSGRLLCGATCIDPLTSAQNCGACGVACPAGQPCVNGACQAACVAPLLVCSGACVDPRTDAANCGTCGHACAAGQSCSAGACTAGCPTGQTSCSGACVDTQTDAANCRSCGNACPAGSWCAAGACAACPAGFELCNGVCTVLASDEQNCGACGAVCFFDRQCVGSGCVCKDGWTSCNGQCRPLLQDPENCGACGVQCAADQRCNDGVCGPPCNYPTCGGVCFDFTTDESNCGTCGIACPPSATCTQSHCVPACPAGQALCGGVCIDTQEDEANCGACGHACAAGQTCHFGACTTGCVTAETLCNGQCVNEQVDVQNCGGCGVACPIGRACVGGACTTACLGAAANFAVLAMTSRMLHMDGVAQIDGDVGLAGYAWSPAEANVGVGPAPDVWTGGAYVHSTASLVYDSATYLPSDGVHFGTADARLNAANGAVAATDTAIAPLPPDLVFGDVSVDLTLTSTRALTVVDLQKLTYDAKVLTLRGRPGMDDTFVLRVLGDTFDWKDSRVVLENVRPERVLWIASSPSVDVKLHGANTLFEGTLFVRSGDFHGSDAAVLDGELIGGYRTWLSGGVRITRHGFDAPCPTAP